MKTYKNGYLLTDEEHDFAIKHKHQWNKEMNVYDHPISRFRATLEISHCECGATRMLTVYGWRVLIPMAPNRGPRSLEL